MNPGARSRACLVALLPSSTAGGPFQIFTSPGAAEELVLVHDDLAARNYSARVASHLITLEHRIIHPHVMRLCADGVQSRGIPNDDIGVAPRSEQALARVQSEDARGRSGGDFDKAIEREFTRVHSMMIDQLQPVLDAGSTVGDFGEIILAEHLLIGETERAVIG